MEQVHKSKGGRGEKGQRGYCQAFCPQAPYSKIIFRPLAVEMEGQDPRTAHSGEMKMDEKGFSVSHSCTAGRIYSEISA